MSNAPSPSLAVTPLARSHTIIQLQSVHWDRHGRLKWMQRW